MTRIVVLTFCVAIMATTLSAGGQLDRTAVDIVAPADIKWVRNAAGTNESAVLSAIRASRGRTWCGSSGCPAT